MTMRIRRNTNRGVSLLELTVSTAIVAIIITAATGAIRTSQGIWYEYDEDAAKLQSAHATALNLARELRQCVSVSAISGPSDTAGTITAVRSDSQVIVWALVSGEALFGINTADNLLADGLTSLTFTGYEADGSTTTTVPADIRSVEFVVTTVLDRPVNPTKNIRARVWLRAW